MSRLYIPEQAQPFPATKTEVGGLLCEVPKRWIESFKAALERQLDGIFDGTPHQDWLTTYLYPIFLKNAFIE